MPARQLAAVRKSTIVRSFPLLERVAPGIGARLAETLWFAVPRARAGQDRQAPPGRRFRLPVQGRMVVGEVWGEEPLGKPVGEEFLGEEFLGEEFQGEEFQGERFPGEEFRGAGSAGPGGRAAGGRPTVYLVHGWGGWRGQLDAFVGPLVEAGHRVVAYDAPSHGESDPGPAGPGRSTALELAAALTAVVAAHGPAGAVIAHSLGATAMAFALGDGLAVGRAAFVAPMADPLPYTRAFAARLGFGERVRTRLVDRVERRVGLPLSAFDVPALASRVETPPLLLVHDRQDAETGWSDSAAIAHSWPGARLVTTTGLGHRRILRAPAVVAEVVGFVTAAPGDQDGGDQPGGRWDRLGEDEAEAVAGDAVR